MPVFHEHALIALKNMTTGKLQETHSMAMVCKTAFESANDKIVKHKPTGTKIKFHIANVKCTKTTTPYTKNDNVMRSKHLKLNVPYANQLATSPNAIAACANKKKPHDLRSAKRCGTMHESQGNNVKSIKMSTTTRSYKINLLGTSGIATVDNAMRSATASSSSPCLNSPVEMIPKNTFHGR